MMVDMKAVLMVEKMVVMMVASMDSKWAVMKGLKKVD